MPGTFIVHNGLVDISFVWPNIAIAKAQEIVFGAAHYLWTKGYGPTIETPIETVQKPWEDLTTQEKLTMTFAYTQHMLIEMAKTSLVDVDTGAAREAAIEYANQHYRLEA